MPIVSLFSSFFFSLVIILTLWNTTLLALSWSWVIAINDCRRQTSIFVLATLLQLANRRNCVSGDLSVWNYLFYLFDFPSPSPLGFLPLAVCRQSEGNVVLLKQCSARQTRWLFCYIWTWGPNLCTPHWLKDNTKSKIAVTKIEVDITQIIPGSERGKVRKCLS